MYNENKSEQLRELSIKDLNFLDEENEDEPRDGSENEEEEASNSTVRDLDKILDKFEADTQVLLDNPNQLLNCKCLFESFFFRSLSLRSLISGFPVGSIPFRLLYCAWGPPSRDKLSIAQKEDDDGG